MSNSRQKPLSKHVQHPVSKTRRGPLSEYVERVINEKRLSRCDVKLRSGGEITDSYVSGIISGSAKNLTVKKLKALARGLRVPEMELIRAAFGVAVERGAHRNIDQSHNLVLLDMSRKNVIGPDIAEIVQEAMKLTPADRSIVLQYVKRLSAEYRKVQRRRRSL